MEPTKVINQGTTEVGPGAMGNPPPYSDPSQSGYYPQPGYPAPGTQVHFTSPGQVTTGVIHTVTPVMITHDMGSKPVNITCNSCQAQIITRVEPTPNTKTHLFALLLCLIGCWPCVCIPYCMDGCMSAQHYCPHCNSYLGSSIN